MAFQGAEARGGGLAAALFRVPDHTEPTFKHNVIRVARIRAEDGSVTRTVLQRVKIVGFGQVIQLGSPNPDTQDGSEKLSFG
jgi:hypothetical protein